jgi:hypothetical protein
MENFIKQLRHGLTCDPEDRAHTVVEKALCIATHPGNLLLRPFYGRYEKRYVGKYKFARSVFLFDLFLVGLVLGLALTALILFVYKPTDFADKIFFETEVAPANVVTGAPSTLILRYTNGTGEELTDVSLTVGYPAHFLLQELSLSEKAQEGETISIGTITPGATGTVKIRGIMFGDVGKEQVFRSVMTFTHGEKHIRGQKISYHPVVPVRSALELSLTLPERLVAYQPIEGTITYRNTGPVDFPEVAIQPEWPESFAFTGSSVAQIGGSWTLPAITSGSEGTVTFTGSVNESAESVTFIFHPSFLFGEDRYRQETLVHNAPLVPPQIKVSHSVDADSARPGGTLSATVRYENVGDTPVYDLVLTLESDSPFVASVPETNVGTVNVSDSGEVVIEVPLRSSIQQSETDVYEHLDVTLKAKASYRLEGVASQKIINLGEAVSTPLTTPVVLRSFGRYASEQGDQLGRGPLPPLVGEETKYWIFWNISGTTNPLSNVTLTGHLPSGVTFTGRQTVSLGDPVSASSGTITWNAASVSPTFGPTAKIVGIAFEVAIVPTDAQVGTAPTLLSDVQLTATDARTGAVITSSGAAVTTNLPNDVMAAGLGVVEF